MDQNPKTIRLNISKAEDRKTVAAILFDNGYPVKPLKDYKRKSDGSKTSTVQYFLVVGEVEETTW